jgi:hypothetical protein
MGYRGLGLVRDGLEGFGRVGGWRASAERLIVALVVAVALLVCVAPVSGGAGAVGDVAALRTAFSTTQALGAGKFQTTVSRVPVNYRDAKGQWQPISSKLVPASASGYAYQNEANSVQLSFPSDITTGVKTVLPSGAGFTLTPVQQNQAGPALISGGLTTPAASSPAGQAVGDSVTYKNVSPSADLAYTAVADGMKEALVLANAQAPSSYTFQLQPLADTSLLAFKNPDGSWTFRTAVDPAPLFTLDVPVVSDSAGVDSPAADGSDAHNWQLKVASLDVQQQLTGSFLVTVSVDPTWLANPARVFPVVIDPNIQTLTQDASFQTDCPTCFANASATTVGSGKDNASTPATWGSALQWDVSAIPTGAAISGVSMSLYFTGCAKTCPASTGNFTANLNAYQMTTSWNTSTTTTADLRATQARRSRPTPRTSRAATTHHRRRSAGRATRSPR